MTTYSKSRNDLTFSGTGIYTVSSGSTNYPYSMKRVQRTTSQGHPGWRNLGKTNEDIGGGFTSQVAYCFSPGNAVVDLQRISKTSGAIVNRYQGSIFAYRTNFNPNTTDFPVPSTDSQMNGYGATGIARALPTNPLSGMGQFLGELRDLPKAAGLSLWKARAKGFKELARSGSKEYLNVQFGWVPFVKDITDFLKVTKHKDALIDKYSRESGRKIHRGSTVMDESSATQTVVGTNQPVAPSPSGFIAGRGTLIKNTVTRRRIWFRGAFTYYLPDGKTPASLRARRRAILRKLYGVTITPDLMWQLAPWSWAIDWVTNVGDVIRNWVAFQQDGLVMHYGYVMETKTITETYTLVGIKWPTPNLAYDYKSGPSSLFQVFLYESKKRNRATPYGFGLSPSGFSAKQWSIIAALGISRKPRAL